MKTLKTMIATIALMVCTLTAKLRLFTAGTVTINRHKVTD
jgi:hypothetical protein